MTGPAKTTCRSCGEPIIWAITQDGKRMPVDAEPVANGNLLLSPGPCPTATIRTRGKPRPPGTTLYVSHFATCRQAGQHRKPVAARPSVPAAMPQEGLFKAPPEFDDDTVVDRYHDRVS